MPATTRRRASRSFYQTVHERLLAIPGVKAGVVTTDLPLRADGERRAFTPEGRGSDVGAAAEHRADVGTRRLLRDVRHPAHSRPQLHAPRSRWRTASS